jgi:hypothetical protein
MSSVLLCVFCGQKDSVQKIFINKCFPFTVGSVCRVKRFTTWSRNVENVSLMTNRLKRRSGSGWNYSQKLLCCGFRRTGKTMGQMYQCWRRIWWEINVFIRFEYHMFYVLYPFVTCLLTLPRILKTGLTCRTLVRILTHIWIPIEVAVLSPYYSKLSLYLSYMRTIEQPLEVSER